MAFDKDKPYGWHLGGALHGCIGQDGKNYRADGTEVDDQNKPVKAAKAATAVVKAKPAEVVDPNAAQLAAQLKA